MEHTSTSAIGRLVAHQGGPAAVSRALGGTPVYQAIQLWVQRGWASPMHIFRLKPLMPKGMKVEDLAADRDHAKAAERAVA